MDDESELESLASERAKALVNALESGRVPQAKLLTTRVHENPKFDVVRLALEVSVAQRAPVAIRSVEELEIYFSRSSDDLPMVVPVRQDFPLDQLHIMQGGRGVPNSICLWDIPFSDIRSTLTPVGLLQRIQTWLEKAADGELHDPDQPAEPLLYVADAVLILPTKVAGKAAEELSVASISQQENGTAYIRLSENLDRNKNEEYSVVPFTLGPVQQAPTRIAPRNLEDLFQLPEGLGSSLRAQISDWLKCSDNRRHLETEHVIIVIQIQKRRNEASEDITIEGHCVFDKPTV